MGTGTSKCSSGRGSGMVGVLPLSLLLKLAL